MLLNNQFTKNFTAKAYILFFFLVIFSAAPPSLQAKSFWDLFDPKNDGFIFKDKELWKMRGELTATYSVSDWTPAPIKGSVIETTGLNIALVELNLRNGIYDRLWLPKLPSIRYEWTPGQDSELQHGLQESLVKAKQENSFSRLAAGTSILGQLIGDDFHGGLDFDYEVFAFSSTIKLKEDKKYTPFGGESQTLSAGSEVTTLTLFERWRLVLSVLFDIQNPRVQHTLDIGPFYSTYQKPYAITIEGQQERDILDTRFKGSGISLKYLTLHRLLGGESEEEHTQGLYLKTILGMDFGPGEVEFANDTLLREKLPPNEEVLFIGVNGDADLTWTFKQGISLRAGGGIRYYNFQATQGGYSYANVGQVDVNEDFVWFANLGLTLAF